MIIHGDCLEKLKELPDNSVDSCVTDPPYELGFMGKTWDNTGIANNVDMWREVLRVLKPGGHLLSFGGTRTYHRMACAIEDAGFEIRDQIGWVYASGFPKSLSVGKAIDKMRGVAREVVETKRGVGFQQGVGDTKILGKGAYEWNRDKGTSEWEGWGTALKPAWEPIVVARKPLSEGTVAANVLRWGTGGINIDKCRITPHGTSNADTGCSPGGKEGSGDSSLNIESSGKKRTAQSLMDLSSTTSTRTRAITESKTSKSSDAANTGGITAKSTSVSPTSLKPDESSNSPATNDESKTQNGTPTGNEENENGRPVGRWPSNLIHDGSDEVVGMFPNTKGEMHNKKSTGDSMFLGEGETGSKRGYSVKDSGSAARFFYCAKASKKDRDEGLEGFEEKESEKMDGGTFESASTTATERKSRNFHPTVKPTELMRYLCRLVTPPGGTVLDPFTGSGSTGKAAKMEGFEFIGIEKEEEYVRIAEARIAAVPDTLL